MGSSLGPVFANIIMTELENVIVRNLLADGTVAFYARYVDHTLLLIRPEDVQKIEKRSYIHYDPRKQDKTLVLSKHWSADSTPARNEVIMKRTYPVKSVKCNKICSNY